MWERKFQLLRIIRHLLHEYSDYFNNSNGYRFCLTGDFFLELHQVRQGAEKVSCYSVIVGAEFSMTLKE